MSDWLEKAEEILEYEEPGYVPYVAAGLRDAYLAGLRAAKAAVEAVECPVWGWKPALVAATRAIDRLIEQDYD